MSLTSALRSPRTPIRRFLDAEMTAGTWLIRADYRARLTSATAAAILDPAVRSEAGTVGTAIDHRLRLGFTTSPVVPAATLLGIEGCATIAQRSSSRQPIWAGLATTGRHLVTSLEHNVQQLNLDSRRRSLGRSGDDEDHLARMLLIAAWYAVLFRAPLAFGATPLWRAAQSTLELDDLLAAIDHRLVDDVVAQVELAVASPLEQLRRKTARSRCCPDAIFDGSADVAADADLIADGQLIDFKSAAKPFKFPKCTIQQLLGYALLDYSDAHGIDAVGIYLSRVGCLISWPIEDYLDLLGIRQRDLPELRSVFSQLCQQHWPADWDPVPEDHADVERVLRRLRRPHEPGRCQLCGTLMPAAGTTHTTVYCSDWCRRRSMSIFRARRGGRGGSVVPVWELTEP